MTVVQYLWSHHAEALEAFGAVVLATTAAVAALRGLIRAFRGVAGVLAALAALTPTDADNRAVAFLVRCLDWASTGLDKTSGFLGWLTRVARPASLLPPEPARKGPRPYWPSGSGLALLLAVGVAGAAQGCAGVPRPVRTALEVSAEAVTMADQVVGVEYTAAHERALEESATLGSYRHRMEKWNRAEEALRAARGAILTMEAAANAWDATGDGDGFRDAAACGITALRELVDVLDVVHVNTPRLIRQALTLLEAFGGSCGFPLEDPDPTPQPVPGPVQ